MKAMLFAMALVAGFATQSFAGELDNSGSVVNQQAIQGTLVVRVDNRTKETAAVQAPTAASNSAQAQQLAISANFQTLPATNVRSELDQDGGASSWYFYNPYGGYNNYPSYNNCVNWYGNWYQPYYTYNYNYYTYYYYSNYNYGYGWR